MNTQTDGLARLVALGLPLMSAEDANREVVRLTVENMKLQAELDAINMRLRNFVEGVSSW